MSTASLQRRLFALEGFQQHLRQLTIASVASQFRHLIPDAELPRSPIDWSYMLSCASVLASSELGLHQAAALRIAQHAIYAHDKTSAQSLAAAVVLDALSNRIAVDLAARRNLLPSDHVQQLPSWLQLERLGREAAYSIQGADGRFLYINRFQKDVFDSIRHSGWTSISAPTSSGKSFILLNWLASVVRSCAAQLIVYIVPTRALIQQVQMDLQDILKAESAVATITSLPLVKEISSEHPTVFILTQERLHYLLRDVPNLTLDLLVVDEAQKVGDAGRGVLLQQVIEDAVRMCPGMKVVFSAPMVSNPELLLSDAPADAMAVAVRSEHVTVNQNLLWVSQVPRKPTRWRVSVCLPGSSVVLGTAELASCPMASTRLALVSHALADPDGGNIVYVNTAAEAEKTARQLAELRHHDGAHSSDSDVKTLVSLVRKAIHKDYALAEVLPQGVAFHYGNMPLLIRTEIERLFKTGKLAFLVCTATLLEGVNLPGRSIFTRSPKKGIGTPMGEADFWNLAGRAGRWGKEFQGNIFCVDPDHWLTPPPTERKLYGIKRTTDAVLAQSTEFGECMDASARPTHPQVDVFSYLFNTFIASGSLKDTPLAKRYDGETIASLEEQVNKVQSAVRVPSHIMRRNPGVSPLRMQSLLVYFENREGPPEELMPVRPESDDAYDSYLRIIARINTHLTAENHARNAYFALLVTNWMRGHPLARIISDNLRWHEEHDTRSWNTAAVIRDSMRDVEEFARFKFPKYVGCYTDILTHHLKETGHAALAGEVPELNIWLEFGVSQQTQLSLMSLGLSRTTAIALSSLIVLDSLNEEQCLSWLRSQNLDSLDASPIIVAEIKRVVEVRA